MSFAWQILMKLYENILYLHIFLHMKEYIYKYTHDTLSIKYKSCLLFFFFLIKPNIANDKEK